MISGLRSRTWRTMRSASKLCPSRWINAPSMSIRPAIDGRGHLREDSIFGLFAERQGCPSVRSESVRNTVTSCPRLRKAEVRYAMWCSSPPTVSATVDRVRWRIRTGQQIKCLGQYSASPARSCKCESRSAGLSQSSR